MDSGYQWISMIWSDTNVLNMWLWILDPDPNGPRVAYWAKEATFGKCCASQTSTPERFPAKSQWITLKAVCSTDFGSHTGAKHYEHRNTHSALRLCSSEIARSTRMQICSRWSYASCSDCKETISFGMNPEGELFKKNTVTDGNCNNCYWSLILRFSFPDCLNLHPSASQNGWKHSPVAIVWVRSNTETTSWKGRLPVGSCRSSKAWQPASSQSAESAAHARHSKAMTGGMSQGKPGKWWECQG
jgi:hypothetical protein